MKSHERSWRVMKGYRRSLPDTRFTIQVRKIMNGVMGWWPVGLYCQPQSMSLSSFSLDFGFDTLNLRLGFGLGSGTWIWELYLGLGFGTWILGFGTWIWDLDLGLGFGPQYLDLALTIPFQSSPTNKHFKYFSATAKS